MGFQSGVHGPLILAAARLPTVAPPTLIRAAADASAAADGKPALTRRARKKTGCQADRLADSWCCGFRSAHTYLGEYVHRPPAPSEERAVAEAT